MLKKLIVNGAKKAIINKISGKKSVVPVKHITKIGYIGARIQTRNLQKSYLKEKIKAR